jgi:oligoribonuclease
MCAKVRAHRSFHRVQTIDDSGPQLVVHHDQSILDTMNEWCQKWHRETGLTNAVKASTISMAEAEQQIVDFINENSADAPARRILAGNSVYVDRYFLAKDMPKIEALLDATIVDCSALSEIFERIDPSIIEHRPLVKGQVHRALADIRKSLDELRYYRKNAFGQRSSSNTRKAAVQHKPLLWIELNPSIHCILTDGNLDPIAELDQATSSDELIRFLRRNGIEHERTVPLAGRALGPLRASLRRMAPEFNEFCHYRSVDVDVVSLLCEKWFSRAFQQRPDKCSDNTLRDTIELLRYYRTRIFK